MSQPTADNYRKTCLTALAGLASAASLLLSSTAALASEPPASPRPGYFADTSCSEGSETARVGRWAPSGSPSYPLLTGLYTTCSTPYGAMTVRDEGAHNSTPGTGPALVYEALLGDTFAGGFVNLTMTSPGGEAYLGTPNTEGGWDFLASCNETCTGVRSETVTIPDNKGWILTAQALCRAPSGQTKCTTTGVNAELSMTRSTLLLQNDATPEASDLAGSLTESPVAGVAALSFEATDKKGPGVYRVAVQVDGAEVWNATPNLNEDQCVAHGTYSGALNFHEAQPCPQETPVRVEIPTTTIPDGPHLIEVEVEDAAGNKSIVFDKTITVKNHLAASPTPVASTPPSTPPATGGVAQALVIPPARGPANGTPASEQATLAAAWLTPAGKASGRAHLASTYGHAQKVTGRLTDPTGAPIAGAAIEVSETPASLGASATSIAIVHTAADGTFSLKLPGNLSAASIVLSYRSHLGDPLAAASKTLTLAMPAQIRLTVSPRVTSVGRTIAFTGTLAGPIPPGGKQVVLEARAVGGQWVEFHNPTAKSGGQFSATHRFTYPGPARYEFRAICKKEADFPFSEGASNIVRVRER
jgi:hypothetical protein